MNPPIPEQHQQLNPDRTQVALSLAKAGIVAGAILAAGFGVGVQYRDLMHKVAGLESRVGDLPTKGDISILSSGIDARVREVLKTAIFNCPSAVRRQNVWVQCQAIFDVGTPAPRGR